MQLPALPQLVDRPPASDALAADETERQRVEGLTSVLQHRSAQLGVAARLRVDVEGRKAIVRVKGDRRQGGHAGVRAVALWLLLCASHEESHLVV